MGDMRNRFIDLTEIMKDVLCRLLCVAFDADTLIAFLNEFRVYFLRHVFCIWFQMVFLAPARLRSIRYLQCLLLHLVHCIVPTCESSWQRCQTSRKQQRLCG